jgi:hypothetical protein
LPGIFSSVFEQIFLTKSQQEKICSEMEIFFTDLQKYASVKGKIFAGRKICSKSEKNASFAGKNMSM